MQVETEIVRASEMREKVFQRIWEIRTGEDRKRAVQQYERELARYEKQRGKRPEIEFDQEDLMEIAPGGYFSNGTKRYVGFATLKHGKPQFHQRPPKPQLQDEVDPLWYNQSRHRVGGHVFPARQSGLLANAAYNRDIRPERVEQYVNEMTSGKWVDLLSDPITITTEGQVLNGQHRLAALADCLYDEYVRDRFRGMGDTDPAFLVVWNVDPTEALYADGSHRTAHDEKTIAVKLVKGVAA